MGTNLGQCPELARDARVERKRKDSFRNSCQHSFGAFFFPHVKQQIERWPG